MEKKLKLVPSLDTSSGISARVARKGLSSLAKQED